MALMCRRYVANVVQILPASKQLVSVVETAVTNGLFSDDYYNVILDILPRSVA